MSGFFLWTLLQKGSERCVLNDFDLQNYPSPCPLVVIFNVSTCIQAREHDSNLCNGHRQDVSSWRCCGEQRRSSRVITAGSRWQCSGLRCGWSSDSIAEETDSSPDPELGWRGETTALLLFFVVHLSDLRVRSHHSHCLSQAFFGGRQELPRERNFPRFDWSLKACAFSAFCAFLCVLTPRTRAESNIAGFIDALLPPLFFIPLPPSQMDQQHFSLGLVFSTKVCRKLTLPIWRSCLNFQRQECYEQLLHLRCYLWSSLCSALLSCRWL